MNSIWAAIGSVAFCLACWCAHAPRNAENTPPPAIPTVNEKLWLQPVIDNSGIEGFDFWPRDTAQRAILARHNNDIGRKLLTEFRRCEKFGHYEMVDDSLKSTIRITVTIKPCRMQSDTLNTQVAILAAAPLGGDRWEFVYDIHATAPVTRRKNEPFHYAGLLMVDLSNSFPYQRIVYPFYRPAE